ncbi:MAG: hypothetical protein HOO06_12290 [Bdellovibrionaceae bacterium]|jgi:hypothetical protein|nr:hypothetical protein [Pseudobdellovibrionaceae bacterium]
MNKNKNSKKLLKTYLVICFLYYFIINTQSAFGNQATHFFESETFFAARMGKDLSLETPLYEYITSHYGSANRELTIDSSFGMNWLQQRNEGQLDVHLLSLNYRPKNKRYSLYAGRQFNPQDWIVTMVTDSVGGSVDFLNHRLKLGTIFGEARSLENLDDLSARRVAAKVSYVSDAYLPWTVGAKVETVFKDTEENLNLSQVYFNKQFYGFYSSEIKSSIQLNTNDNRVQHFNFDWDIYPTIKGHMGLTTSYVNLKQNDGLFSRPIYSIFSTGDLKELGFKFGRIVNSKTYFSMLTAYDSYQIEQNQMATGYKVKVAIDYKDARLKSNSSLYYLQSYGGELYGTRVFIRSHWWRGFDVIGTLDVSYYKKVTSSERFVSLMRMGLGKWMWKNFDLQLVGEVGNNNENQNDVRILSKLRYFFWRPS